MWLTWLRVLNVFLFLFWSASAQNIRSDTFVCPKENGFFAHDISCDKYWKCVEGVATLELCGNGLAFDDTDLKNQRENCDYIYNVECGDRLEVGESVPLLTWSIWVISRFNYWRLSDRGPNQHPELPELARSLPRWDQVWRLLELLERRGQPLPVRPWLGLQPGKPRVHLGRSGPHLQTRGYI